MLLKPARISSMRWGLRYPKFETIPIKHLIQFNHKMVLVFGYYEKD
jgi:hypothetical protein